MMLHATASGTFAGIPVAPALGLTVLACAYVRGMMPTRAPTRAALFVAAWLVLAVALASPLHAAGERLLSMHMVQHVLLMAVAAPLLVMSAPAGAILRGLPRGVRVPVAASLRYIAPLRRSVTTPAAACLVQAAGLWIWHLPALYNAASTNLWVHALQHSTLLVTALLFWSSIPLRSASRAGAAQHGASRRNAAGVASLFMTTLQMGGLAAMLAFARVPWYAVYVGPGADGALGALADQQIGALIMWVPGAFPYILAALVLVRRTLRAQESTAIRFTTPRPLAGGSLHVGLVALVAICAVLATGCDKPRFREGNQIAGGDARRGRALLKEYGCRSCHTIAGVSGGHAVVGPPLAGLRDRAYIAGVLTNSPDNLVRWIQDPKSVDSLTAMPKLNVSAGDARDIASYLYSIK